MFRFRTFFLLQPLMRILFLEHYYDKRYKYVPLDIFCEEVSERYSHRSHKGGYSDMRIKNQIRIQIVVLLVVTCTFLWGCSFLNDYQDSGERESDRPECAHKGLAGRKRHGLYLRPEQR